MHMYYGYHFMGMHLIWWFIWVVFIITLFGWYDPIPKKRRRNSSL